ncbi:MAG: hypothetical protein V4582_06310 [Pseudomonadota bacterium]
MISLKLVWVSLVQLATAAVILIVAILAYGRSAEHSAEGRARAFCSATKPGETADVLFARAMLVNADRHQTRWSRSGEGGRILSVTFTGALPLSRHIRAVRADALVTESSYAYLD